VARRRRPLLLALVVLAVVALLLFADRAVIGVLLLMVALLFALAVAIFALVVVLMSQTNPPAWMLDEDETLLGLPRRMRLALDRAVRRLRERPNRSAERLIADLAKAADATVWEQSKSAATAYSHLHIALHPQTVERIDQWMPIEDVAAETAYGYARAHQARPRKSSLVVVLIGADPEVPVGRCTVEGTFREASPARPTARAWARLAGPLAPRLANDAHRFGGSAIPPSPATRQMPQELAAGEDPTRALLLAEGDRTRILPGGSAAAADPEAADPEAADPEAADPEAADPVDPAASTALLEVAGPEPTPVPPAPAGPPAPPAPPVGVLHVQRCQPGGGVLPDAPDHVLAAGRSWTVGRDRAADVQCPEPHVSRLHAEFVPGADGWSIIDRSSRGTLVNGRPVTSGIPSPVRPGDVVELGTPSRLESVRVLLLLS
jgi:hypothetical protein